MYKDQNRPLQKGLLDVTVQCAQGKTKANPTPMALWDEQRADLDGRVIISGKGGDMGIKEELRESHMKASLY